jgi:hypothetical protein
MSQPALIRKKVQEERGSPLLFPARGPELPFSGWSKCKKALDKVAKIAPWTLHDLRRTFRWLVESPTRHRGAAGQSHLRSYGYGRDLRPLHLPARDARGDGEMGFARFPADRVLPTGVTSATKTALFSIFLKIESAISVQPVSPFVSWSTSRFARRSASDGSSISFGSFSSSMAASSAS